MFQNLAVFDTAFHQTIPEEAYRYAIPNKFLEENKGKIAYFAGIDNCKFKRKVIPGDTLVLDVEIVKQRGPVGFGKATATVNGEVAVTAELKFAIG